MHRHIHHSQCVLLTSPFNFKAVFFIDLIAGALSTNTVSSMRSTRNQFRTFQSSLASGLWRRRGSSNGVDTDTKIGNMTAAWALLHVMVRWPTTSPSIQATSCLMPGDRRVAPATYDRKDEAPVVCSIHLRLGVNLPDGLVIPCFCWRITISLIPLSSLG